MALGCDCSRGSGKAMKRQIFAKAKSKVHHREALLGAGRRRSSRVGERKQAGVRSRLFLAAVDCDGPVPMSTGCQCFEHHS